MVSPSVVITEGEDYSNNLQDCSFSFIADCSAGTTTIADTNPLGCPDGTPVGYCELDV